MKREKISKKKIEREREKKKEENMESNKFIYIEKMFTTEMKNLITFL